MNKEVYLVPKVGQGKEVHYGERVSEILIGTEVKLKKDSLNNVKVLESGKLVYKSYIYNKKDILIIVDGLVVGEKNRVQQDYFVYEDKTEAIEKYQHILNRLEEEMLKKAKEGIKKLLNGLKNDSIIKLSSEIVPV